jgi:hypothetical protein
MPRYPEPRILAYFDIIGWSAASCNLADARRVKRVAAFLESKAESRANDERQKRWNATADSSDVVRAREERLNFQLSVFSDNVAISTTPAHARELVLRTAEFCRFLLLSGFLARGGITAGLLLHRENLIFGPALVRAVALEKCASKPRLLIDPDASAAVEADAVLQDQDGKKILNWFTYGSIPGSLKSSSILELSSLDSAVVRGLKDASLEKHKRKWRYMRKSLVEMRNHSKSLGLLRNE